MPLAGHAARLKISGVPVGVVAEACTSLGAGAYQITNAARRIMDPASAFVFKDGGVAIPVANITLLDALFGKVTFNPAPAGAVTVDFSYVPVATLTETKGASFSADAGLVDSTTFDANGVRKRKATLKDCSGSVQMLSTLLDDIDPVTVGGQTLFTVITNGTPKLLELQLGTIYIRAWVLFAGAEEGAEVSALVETSLEFQGQPMDLSTSGLATSFSIST